ncbi:hypothetical protein LBMAG48_15940 [Phycisphaerae bacterium]|nr:hypothetical protein LBMAG48_15940 [Phycisphaerae bacterium]
MRNRKLRVIFVASTAAICAVSGASAQLVNSGWEFLQPVGATLTVEETTEPCFAVGAMTLWDPDGPGTHTGFIAVSGGFSISRAEGSYSEFTLIDASSGQWMPLQTSHDVYARHLSVEIEADGTQSLFAVGAIRANQASSQVSRAGLLRHGQWTLYGAGTYGLHSLPPDAVTWKIGEQRFMAVAHNAWLPEFYDGTNWAPFGSGSASFIPRLPTNWTKMMQAIPQVGGGVHLVHAGSIQQQGDRFLRFTGGPMWEPMGTVRPIHGAKSFVVRRADGRADLIAGIEVGSFVRAETGVGLWDGNTWQMIAPDAGFQQIIPYPNPAGAFNVLVTDESGVYADGAIVPGPVLWDGSAWQSLQFPGGLEGVSSVVLGPGAPGQQDIYVGGNLRDPLTGLRTVVARLRWQNIRPSRCFRTDFNSNGVTPEPADVVAFFDALAGASCPTWQCMSLDFNRNGVSPEEQDVVDFLSAYMTDCGP